jgi:two-component system, OmpR family, clock-associated histidine kinase SasA
MSVEQSTHKNSEPALQLLLFVDDRPHSSAQNQEIEERLRSLQQNYRFDLETIDVGQHPDLAEHYKIMATPALVKIRPLPQHMLAGSNLTVEIDNWWEQWQGYNINESETIIDNSPPSVQELQTARIEGGSVEQIRTILKLEDGIFNLKQEKEELTERLEFQDRAIAMLAHDLRNPLTAAGLALGTLEIVHSPTDARTLDRQAIGKLILQARAQIDAIEKLIADILEPLKNSRNELHLHPQRIDLGPIILDTIAQVSSQFNRKQQSIATDIPSDLPAVYADGERVKQVMTNLLDNASKYTPKGGKIRIAVLHRTAQSVQISISDTGLGIPESDRHQIFQDRYRIPRDSRESGYGLGLGLCQRIVRAHYGQIWVESELGKGSCFHFTLLVYQR